MKHMLTVSITRRLTIAFGALILLFAAAMVFVQRQQEQTALAQERLTSWIAPRTAAAWALERAVLLVGIGVRSYVLNPTAEQRGVLERDIAGVRDALDQLRAFPKEPDGQALFDSLVPPVLALLVEVDAIARARPEFSVELERKLVQIRVAALGRLQAYSQLQARRSALAIALMNKGRERASLALFTTMLLASGVMLVVAVLTTFSMRRATGELLELAESLSRGDWQRAIGWSQEHRRPPRAARYREFQQIGNAFSAAGEAIEARERELQVRSRVSAATAASLDASVVADGALRAITEHAGADVGVVQLVGEHADALSPIATVGGESAGILALRDGVGGRSVLSAPLRLHERSIGVLTLSSLTPFTAAQMRVVNDAAMQLGLGLKNVTAYREIEGQRERMQQQHEQVQAQNEELQAQSEELQAQSEEIQAQNEELQAQSEEIQAQNEQLLAQSEQLQLADIHKNDFLALLAHELRNPLAAVSNSVFLLSSIGGQSELVDRARTIIDRQTRQLTRLIDELLDITRIARGKLHLERVPLDLCVVLRESIADVRGALDRRNLELEIACPEEPIAVLADRSRLAQIFGNLLENATKFTEGGGHIRVTVQRLDGRVRVVFADSGIGIQAELIPRLFQPFVQADLSRTRTASGLGLGLSLVHAYVSMHGGTIDVLSEGQGTGTTVVLEFPLLTTGMLPEGDHPADRLAVPRDELAPTAPTALRVLVVEDNADAAESLRDALEVDGHDVWLACGAMEGLQRAREFLPALILCDVGMPHVDGYEFARRIRAEPALADAYVVALTGYAMPEDLERAAKAGFNQHLTKPAPIEALRRVVRNAAATLAAPDNGTNGAAGNV